MKPTKRQETVMAVIVALIILAFLFLTSCSTKKTITEYVTVHDTLVVHHSDTLKIIKETRDTIVDWKYITLHDTLRHDRERVIVVNEQGDTISEREWERLWQKIYELESTRHDESHSDSSSYLKAQNDSLRAVLKAQESKKEVKTTNRPRWWEYIVFVALMILWASGVIWALKIWNKKMI